MITEIEKVILLFLFVFFFVVKLYFHFFHIFLCEFFIFIFQPLLKKLFFLHQVNIQTIIIIFSI